jgi:hypothetical protein
MAAADAVPELVAGVVVPVAVVLPPVVEAEEFEVSTATWVVSEGFFSPPAHAPSIITPTATANP